MSKRPNRAEAVTLNLPELFEDEKFRAYLNDPATKIATWHDRGTEPGEYSDIFVTYDNGEGSNSDMPGWTLVCDLMRENGYDAALVHLTNLDD